MAVFNEILSGRFNRFLQKHFSVKGAPPVRQLGSEVMPVIHVHSGVENFYLQSWEPFSFGESLSGGAGVANLHQMRNPTGSNVICVIEKILLVAGSVATTTIALTQGAVAADLATLHPATASRLDNRGRPQPTAIFSNTQVAVPTDLANTMAFVLLGQTSGFPVTFDYILTDGQEFPLLPGDGLRVRNATVNNSDSWFVMWRERFLEDSERT